VNEVDHTFTASVGVYNTQETCAI